jgi:FkbM family methyltransferase
MLQPRELCYNRRLATGNPQGFMTLDQSTVTTSVAAVTRWLQAQSKRRPIGLTRLSASVLRRLPAFTGEITLDDGLRFHIDSHKPSERELLFVGDRHRGLTWLLRQHTVPGAYCLDVGANLGFYALKLAHWAGPQGRVAAFEANPALLTRIEQNRALNHLENIDIVPQAVTRVGGTTTRFYIAANPELSSITPQSQAEQEIEVKTTSIDEYIAQHQWPRLDVIKMDIEGHDCAALLGACTSIARWRPFIAFEYAYDTDTETARAAFDLLADNGYTLQALTLKTGQLGAIDWRQGAGSKDVICVPPTVWPA